MLIFTIGTLICSLSQDFTELLAVRTIQGVGGGGIIAFTMVISNDIIPPRQRPKYGSIIQLTRAFGTIAGPLVGGLFAQHASSRLVFMMCLGSGRRFTGRQSFPYPSEMGSRARTSEFPWLRKA